MADTVVRLAGEGATVHPHIQEVTGVVIGPSAQANQINLRPADD